MKALLLAAGRGTRVRPLTDAMPKPMIPIVHTPVMELLVQHLRRHGFDQIMVNTSYLSPQIEAYFRDGWRLDVQMGYSFEGYERNGELFDEPLGSAGAIRKIQQHSGFFDNTFLVICGDALVDIDLRKLVREHRARRAIATVALKEMPESELHSYGVVVQDADGRIAEFQEKPAPGTARSNRISTGIYVFEPEILRWIPEHGVYDLGSQLFPALARAGAALHGVTLPFQWLDIGRVTDYYQVVQQALRGEIRGFSLPGREVRPGVWMGLNVRVNLDRCRIVPPLFIGSSATIEDGAELLGPTLIGSACHVGAGARIERSVLLEHTRVAGSAELSEKILSGRYCVGSDGTVIDGSLTDTSWLFADARSKPEPLTDAQQQLLRAAA
jgi:mannose-1-phosphate guanylyltransferase